MRYIVNGYRNLYIDQLIIYYNYILEYVIH